MVYVMELAGESGLIPAVVIRVGDGCEHSGEFGGARWWPSLGPVRASLPELQDRCPGLKRANVGIWIAVLARSVRGGDEGGCVMAKPADQGVVRASVAEFGEDPLAEGDGRVNGR